MVAMKKVVIDTNVIAAAIWSSNKSSNFIIFDQVIKYTIQNYICDQISGEVVRLFNNDQKLKVTNKEYFHSRFDSLIQTSIFIGQGKLENEREYYKNLLQGVPSEDIDIVLTGIISGAGYLITWDKKLYEWINNYSKLDGLKAISPKDFIRIP
jgi:predicted nucleic acid-binding protein